MDKIEIGGVVRIIQPAKLQALSPAALAVLIENGIKNALLDHYRIGRDTLQVNYQRTYVQPAKMTP